MSNGSDKALSLGDGLVHHLNLLSGALQVPIWLVDSQGDIVAQPNQSGSACCDLYKEMRPDCVAFRRGLNDAAEASGGVCPLQCHGGHAFLIAPTPSGGYLKATVVVGGFQVGTPPEGSDVATVLNAPGLRIEEQSSLIGALPVLAGLLKNAAVQQNLVPRLDQALSLLSPSMGQPVSQTCMAEAMEQVLSLAVTGPGVEAAIFELVGEGRVRHIAVRGPSLEVLRGMESPIGMSMAAWAVGTGEELLIPDTAKDPRGHKLKALQSPPRAWMTVPIRVSGAVIGGIQVGWVRPGVPSSLEQSLVRQLAQILSSLWTRMRIGDRLHRLERSITIMGQFLQESRSLPDSIAFSLDLFKSTFGVRDLTFAQAPPRSVEGLPLLPAIHAQNSEEVEVVLPISESLLRISGGVSAAILEENLVRNWLHMLDLRMAVTTVRGERCRAVRAMAGVLADLLGRIDPAARDLGDLAADWVERLLPHLPPEEKVSMLPEAARLINLERALDMPPTAAGLLPCGTSWEPIRDALRCQYERYDGRGPLGLRGRAIPFGARVLAVVRRFLELGGDRPERIGLAMVKLELEAGTAYDSAIVHTLFLTAFPGLRPPGYTPRSLPSDEESLAMSESPGAQGDRVSPRDAMEQRYYLTERESEILRLVSDGASNGEIAKSLYLSVATVKSHVSRILHKMGVGSRSKAAHIYREFSGQ